MTDGLANRVFSPGTPSHLDGPSDRIEGTSHLNDLLAFAERFQDCGPGTFEGRKQGLFPAVSQTQPKQPPFVPGSQRQSEKILILAHKYPALVVCKLPKLPIALPTQPRSRTWIAS